MEKDPGKKMDNVLSGELRLEYNNNRLVVSKNNVDQLLVGQDEQGNVVVKLSQNGIDVKTATDSQLILNSANNLFKIVATSTVTLNSTGSTTGASPIVQTYHHGLGYEPVVIATVEFSGVRIPLPYTLYNVTTGAIRFRIYCEIDTQDVRFIYQDWTGEGPYAHVVRFYLTRETAS